MKPNPTQKAFNSDTKVSAVLRQMVYMAYRKFKSHVYYDSSSLFLRKKLAEFEDKSFKGIKTRAEFSTAFEKSFKVVFDCLGDDFQQPLNNLISQISYTPIPKTIEHKRPWEEKERFITNIIQPKDFEVSKCNALIDAPIEIHVLSVLWLITVGKKLNPVISSSNYAYHLSLYDHQRSKPIDEENGQNATLSSGLMLFEPYFIGYQQWRDNGIKKAEQGLDEKKDVTLLSLDIRRYFYSVRVNVVSEVAYWLNYRKLGELTPLETRLCEILQAVHCHYAGILENASFISKTSDPNPDALFPLPVGLLSSGFLGNLALTPFDEFIHQEITPSYYGRYVDDILMVFVGKKLNPFSNTSAGKNVSPIDNFITRHLIRENTKGDHACQIIRGPIDGDENVSYLIRFGKNSLEVQSSKVLMEYFRSTESRAAINKFKKKLEQNRSEFRLLPFESDVNREFDDAAFKLEYSDSINRLRDVRAISEDKYGASKFLAQKIFLSVLPFEMDKNEKIGLKNSADQILTFFRGVNTLQMYTLWEKVASYFVINSDVKSLISFYNQACEAITEIKNASIEPSLDGNDSEGKLKSAIQDSLRDFLDVSLAMALSLNPALILREEKPFSVDNSNVIKEMIRQFRSSFLFRHNYQYLKAYCYTLDREEDWEKPLLGGFVFDNPIDELKIDVAKFIAPSFLHMQDIAIIENLHSLQTSRNEL